MRVYISVPVLTHKLGTSRTELECTVEGYDEKIMKVLYRLVVCDKEILPRFTEYLMDAFVMEADETLVQFDR